MRFLNPEAEGQSDFSHLADRKPRFGFILKPEFPMNAFILATEALRIANQNSGRDIFEWVTISETGEAVRASNGMRIEPDHPLANFPRCDFVVLLDGNLPTMNISPGMLTALRSAHRHGSTIVSVDTGAFTIAAAGLAGNGDAVLHWEAITAFVEQNPDIQPKNQIYSLDRQLIFCAGGVATLDMMLELIGHLRGAALAGEVANALVHTPREASHTQRIDDEPIETPKKSLSRRIVGLMESNLDFPLSPREIAAQLGVSIRTLERHCLEHFKQTPARLYLRIRLQAARNLLFYQNTEIKEIALACGFSYPSVFSRAFAAQFGCSPRAFRETLRVSQGQTVRPEIVRLSQSRGRRNA